MPTQVPMRTATPAPTLAPNPTSTPEPTVTPISTPTATPTEVPNPTLAPTPTAAPTPTPEPLSVPVIVDRLTDPITLGADFAKYAELRAVEWGQKDYGPWPGNNSDSFFPEGAIQLQSGLLFDYVYTVIEARGADFRGRYGPIYVTLDTPLLNPRNDSVPPPNENAEFQSRSIILLGALGFPEKQARGLILQVFAEYALTGDTFHIVGPYEVVLKRNELAGEDVVTLSVGPAPDNRASSGQAAKSLIARWEGQASKNTQTFHITTEEWSISWDTKPGALGQTNFRIDVYKVYGVQSERHGVAANVIGADRDSTVVRGSGDYYLIINKLGQPYTVTVEALP